MKCIPLLSMLPLDSLIKFWSFFQATTRIKISNIWKFEDTALEMVTTHVCAIDNKETATNCCFVRRLNLNDFSSKTAKNLFNIGSWKVEFYIFVAHELKQWLTQLRSQRIEYSCGSPEDNIYNYWKQSRQSVIWIMHQNKAQDLIA